MNVLDKRRYLKIFIFLSVEPPNNVHLTGANGNSFSAWATPLATRH